jgi:hypothetical protein
MAVLYISVSAAAVAAPAALAQPAPVAAVEDPDEVYAAREDLARARQAAEIWAASEGDFEAAWKLARARYWLGGRSADRALAAGTSGAGPVRRQPNEIGRAPSGAR